jgi:hypothetical protein
LLPASDANLASGIRCKFASCRGSTRLKVQGRCRRSGDYDFDFDFDFDSDSDFGFDSDSDYDFDFDFDYPGQWINIPLLRTMQVFHEERAFFSDKEIDGDFHPKIEIEIEIGGRNRGWVVGGGWHWQLVASVAQQQEATQSHGGRCPCADGGRCPCANGGHCPPLWFGHFFIVWLRRGLAAA